MQSWITWRTLQNKLQGLTCMLWALLWKKTEQSLYYSMSTQYFLCKDYVAVMHESKINNNTASYSSNKVFLQ